MVDLSGRFGLRVLRFTQSADDFRTLLGNFLVVLFPSSSNSLQHFFEGGLTVPIFRRKIRSADKRVQIGREPHTHWPTAATGRRLDEGHVNPIDIWPFFAIDFDVHEFAIHERGGRFIFERLVRHHVTPMTSRITDREKDRFIFAASFGECLLAPRIPIDWVARVLKKVRRLLLSEPICVRRICRLNFRSHGRWCH